MQQYFQLKFLWLDKNLGVAVNEINENGINPVTEYFFWPRKDAWEELRNELARKPWISYENSIVLLNQTTDIINYWQEEENKASLAEVQTKFPDCVFVDQFANCYLSN